MGNQHWLLLINYYKIYQQRLLTFAKLRARRAFMPYVFYVLTCLTGLRAFLSLLSTCLYLFFTWLTCFHFCTCLRCFQFFTCLTRLHFFTCLACPHFYVPYVLSFLYVLTCLHIFSCLTCPDFFLRTLCAFLFLHAVRTFIVFSTFVFFVPYMPSFLTCLHFIYVFANKTRVN